MLSLMPAEVGVRFLQGGLFRTDLAAGALAAVRLRPAVWGCLSHAPFCLLLLVAIVLLVFGGVIGKCHQHLPYELMAIASLSVGPLEFLFIFIFCNVTCD